MSAGARHRGSHPRKPGPCSAPRRALLSSVLLWRNDGQQQVRLVLATRMDGPGATLVVIRVEVGEMLRAHAVQRRDVEPKPVPLLEDHAGRPDLDLSLIH